MTAADVLHHHEFGPRDGAIVLALHGLHGHGGRWRDQAARWPGRRVIAPDLRGHGRSVMLPPWTLEQHAADVVATMDAIGIERCDVVGYSFGGSVAVHVAVASPGRVRRLVLLDPALGMDPRLGYRIAMGLTRPDFADEAEAWVHLVERWTWATPEQIEQELADNVVCDEDGRWRWRFCGPAMATAISEGTRPAVVPPATVPTLLVRAHHDPGPATGFPAAISGLAHVSQVSLPFGHQLLALAPAETAAVVTGFLDGDHGTAR